VWTDEAGGRGLRVVCFTILIPGSGTVEEQVVADLILKVCVKVSMTGWLRPEGQHLLNEHRLRYELPTALVGEHYLFVCEMVALHRS
jgi:hypothetical protein